MTAAIEDILPLTPLQEGMLFHAVSAPESGTYLQQYTYVLHGPLEPADLRAGYRTLVARHPALRTAFVWTGVQRPLQVVRAAADVDIPFVAVDLRGLPAAEQDERMDRELAEQRAGGFDLGSPPLVRVTAARVAEQRTVVLVTDHHLVVDGWSASLLIRELLEVLAGRGTALPPAASLRDYLGWLRAQPDPAPYWRKVLGDVTVPTPLGVDRRGLVTPVDRPVDWQRDERSSALDPGRLAALRSAGLLPSTLAHAAWALTLARQSDVDDVLLGVTVAGRPAGLPDAEVRIGMFVNTLPLRLPVLGPAPVRAWLADVQRRLAEARQWEHTALSVAQDQSGVPRGTPLFESVLAVQNYTSVVHASAPVGPLRLSAGRVVEHTSLPVSLAVAVSDDGMWSRMDSDARRFDPEAAGRMQQRLHGYAEALLSDLDRPVWTVPEPVPDVAVDCPSGTDGEVLGSVTAADGELSAAEVVAGAGRVADTLGSIAPGPVGVALGASVHLPAALLGAAAAGRSVVPLDPRTPAPDLAAAGCVAILAAGDLVPPLPEVLDLASLPAAPSDTVVLAGDSFFGFEAGETVLGIVPVPGAVVRAAMAAGARLRLVDPVLTDPTEVAGVDAVVGATGVLRQLVEAGWHGRHAIATDPLPPALLRDLTVAAGTVAQLHRDALAVSWTGEPPPEHPGAGLPLGRPLPGVRTAIVGADGGPVPADAVGELELDGRRTGDRVRRRPDGSLELVGRAGAETVRIEAALGRLPGVVAAALPDDRTGYVETLDGAPSAAALRRQLLRVLPPHRLPEIIVLPRLPRDAAGQLLLAALTDPAPTPPPEPAPEFGERWDTLPAATRATLLAALDEAADRSRLSDAERATVLAWADGGTASTPDVALGALVEAVAAARPDGVAVDDGREMRYAELVSEARRLARRLADLGVGTESRVAVCLPRTASSISALVGILLAGAAYVPIDASYPAARVRFVLDDAGVTAAVTVGALLDRFAGVPAVCLDDQAAERAALDDGPLDLPVDPGQAAYVLYTSGSTGVPKGVLAEHRAVVDFVTHIAAAYRIDADTRLLGFATLGFDISVFEVFTALAAGATIVLAGDEDRLSADRLQRLMIARRVTAAELPPAIMPQLDPRQLPDLRLVSVGGEAPAGALVDAWATPEREFWNGYGPTEATVAVTLMRCHPPSGGRVPPIGRPMPNHRAYVLDDRLRLVPPGRPGELCVAGPGLARGYLGRPDLTAERFVPDPYGPGKLYRTGDLARWTDDGVLEFLGRVDRQVKIRGYRIEPAEVEAAVRVVPGVRDAVVEAWDDPAGTRHLVAWTTGRPVELAELREVAAGRLPPYMLPTRVVHLAELPLTPSGKVDRKALPPPEHGDATAPELPADALQAELITLVAPLVGVPGLGVADDFFAAGGNSLQATQVLSRVRDAFGVEVGLPEFFAEPTVARLAELVEDARRDAPVPTPAAAPARAGTAIPLAEPQLRLWQRHLADPANPAFHAPLALRLAGPLDLPALRRSVAALVERHPALRSRLDGTSQVVDPAPADPLRLVDLTGVPADQREAAARRTVRAEAELPYDLRNGPVFRPALLRLADDDHVLAWNAHHIVTDAWSIGLQLRDLSTLYSAGGTAELPPVPSTYADFARSQREWMRGDGPEREWAWWRDRLAGAPSTVDLPATPAGTPTRLLPPFRHAHVSLELFGDRAAAVLALCRQAGTTPYVLLVAAFTALLGAEIGRRDVCVVTPVAGRTRTEWESVVGFFVNRVVVRVDLSGRPSMAELVQQVRRRSAEALAHQRLPFDRLTRRLADELGPDAPALRLAVSVQNAPQRHDGLPGLEMSQMGDDRGEPFAPILELYSPAQRPFLLSAVMIEIPGLLVGALEYDAALLDRATASRLAERLQDLLVAAAADPDVPLEDLLGRLG